MNLFSIFDPSSSVSSMSLNWISTLLTMCILPYFYWTSSSRSSISFKSMMILLHNEFKILLTQNWKHTTILFISMFMFILFNNTMGLLPYVFTSTSHMVTNLTLSLPLWMTLMIMGWLKNYKHMLIHLVPQGTPGPLMPFMVVIETISNLIRPTTLAIRLTANMIAGHLLLSLMGGIGPNLTSMIMILMTTSFQMLLMTLEVAVAIIQSYVFAVLSTLYMSEIH